MLKKAYDRWHKEHPLIRSLLQPGPDGKLAGKLSITYAPQPILQGYVLKDHDYSMFDHGLFAAGIIHSLAPEVPLNLIEVLNHRGIGALDTIIAALHKLTSTDARTPRIVNCSLMLNLPLLGHPHTDLEWKLLATDCTMITLMARPLEWICDLLADNNVLVVAAAGNDAHGPDGRPQARYPAAYSRVLGVGALNPDDQPAEYSNLADTPLNLGIATFGGAAPNGIAEVDKAIRGIYTGPLPDGTPNTSGWAWWAGTSFAAPVITGTLAALRSKSSDAETAIAALYDVATEPVNPAMIGRVFSVRQG